MSVGHTVLALCVSAYPDLLWETDCYTGGAPALSAPPWGSWGLCPSGVSGAPVVQQWLVCEFSQFHTLLYFLFCEQGKKCLCRSYDSLVSFYPEVDSAAGVFCARWSWQNSPDEPMKMWTCLLFLFCVTAQRISSTYQKKHT